MCFIKSNKLSLKIAKKDIYVLKFTRVSFCTNDLFKSEVVNFKYYRGVLHKKGLWKVFISLFKKYLVKEIFHAQSIGLSKENANNKKPCFIITFGVFKIPKGTFYYTNNFQGIAAFKISYCGLLNDENKNLIINQ